MDLKALLLNSTSGNKIIKKRQRLHFGKLCFSVSYQIAGKFLTVKRIRKCVNGYAKRRQTFLYNRLLMLNRKLAKKPWSTVSLKPIMLETEVQTQFQKKTKSEGTETEKIYQYSQAMQTSPEELRLQATQTDVSYESLGIQAKQHTAIQANQTDWYFISTASQTMVNSSHHQMQTDPTYCCTIQVQTDFDYTTEHMQVEKEAVILLLNEIGEMIINQNHLLHNNSTLLGQISEMTMLNKMVTTQNSAM